MAPKNHADIEMLIHVRQAAQALRALTNQWQKSMHSMGHSTDQVNRRSKKSKGNFDATGKAIKTATRAAAGLAAGLASVLSVSEAVRREFQAVADEQDRARQGSLTYGEHLQSLLHVLPQKKSAVNDMSYEQIRDAIDEANPPDKAVLAQAIVGAISSDSTSPISQRVQAAIDVAQMRPDLATNAQSLNSFSQAVVGQQRLFGGTAQEQAQMIQSGLQVARVVDIEAFSNYLGPAVEKLSELGFSQADAMSLATAYSSASVDKTGETTQTNLVKVMGQVYEYLRTAGKTDIKGMDMIRFIQSDDPTAQQVRRKLIGVMEEGLSPEQLAEAARYGSGKLKGRSAGKMAFFNLFQPEGVGESGTMKQSLAKAIMQIPQTQAELQQAIANIETSKAGDPHYQLLASQRAWDAIKSETGTDAGQGFRSLATEIVTDLPKVSGGYATEGWAKGLATRIASPNLSGRAALSVATEEIRKMEADARARAADPGPSWWLQAIAKHSYLKTDISGVPVSGERFENTANALNKAAERLETASAALEKIEHTKRQPNLGPPREPEATKIADQ